MENIGIELLKTIFKLGLENLIQFEKKIFQNKKQGDSLHRLERAVTLFFISYQSIVISIFLLKILRRVFFGNSSSLTLRTPTFL